MGPVTWIPPSIGAVAHVGLLGPHELGLSLLSYSCAWSRGRESIYSIPPSLLPYILLALVGPSCLLVPPNLVTFCILLHPLLEDEKDIPDTCYLGRCSLLNGLIAHALPH